MLFQKNIIKKYISSLDEEDVQNAWICFKKYFQNPDIQQNIRQSKEEQFQEGFLRELFVKVFGYTLHPSPNYNLITEKKNETNAQKADGAIVIDGNVIGVIELKDTKTTDLSKIESQAFGYKNKHSNCRIVIISNFEKLRLYIDNAVDYKEWNIFDITFEDFKELYLALSYANLGKNVALKMKDDSISNEEQITKRLYKDYSDFKRDLYDDILKNWNAGNPAAGEPSSEQKLRLYKKTQKLLDRFLFIFFAEDCGILPPNFMNKIIREWKTLAELDEYRPLYDRIKKNFRYIDTGYKRKDFEVYAYDGGLFIPDEELDNLKISDDVLEKYTTKMSLYDYESEVDVNILGHIFEHSLNENGSNKRKSDGVFYTPQYITKYIIDNTVGKLCSAKKNELGIKEDDYFADKKRRKEAKKLLYEKLDAYRKWLLQITILDPACGSGAFLNAALVYLIQEHKLIDEMEAKITGDSLVMPNIEISILENNLFGVDINEESVEIAKLSLWLRTAKPKRKLNSLNHNIKCGNSLIDDPSIAGEKAFDWKKEFPQVFEKGGFDVVIGNPPYVQLQKLGKMSDAYAKCGYESFNKSADLYCLFTEQGYKLLKDGGLQSFIMPNKWMIVDYGKELRRFLSKTSLQQILNFGDIQFFQDATTYVCIFVTQKTDVKNNVSALSLNKKTYHGDFENEIPTAMQVFEKETFGEEPWIIRPANHTSILNTMGNGIPLKKLPINIYRGILTGYNEAFFIDGKTRDRLIAEDPKSAEIIKPLLRGRDIQAWISNNDDQFLIATLPSLNINIDNYIAVKKHLLNFGKERLEQTGENGSRKQTQNKWFETQDSITYYNEFSKPKIMYPNMTSSFPFIYDEKGYYGNDKTFIITATDESVNLKTLTAIFNSQLCKLWIWYNCPELQGGTREIRKSYFENFPVPASIPADKQSALSTAADKMQSLNLQLQKKCSRFLSRIKESFGVNKTTPTLEEFYMHDFPTLIQEFEKQKIKLSLAKKDELEEYFDSFKAECVSIKKEIEDTDKEIDRMVCELYGVR